MIVWSIFADARQCFNELTMSPISHLTFLATGLIRYNVPEYSNCPMDRLVPGRGVTNVKQEATQMGGFQDEGVRVGGTSGGGGKRQRTAGAGGINPNHCHALKEPTRKLMSKRPRLSVMDIVDILQGECRLGDLRLGKSGQCQDFHVLGNCRNPQCTYMHNVDVRPQEPKVQRAVGFLNAALQKMQ